MAKKVLSIVIGNDCTKICEISYSKNNKDRGIRIYRSISFSNPENSTDDGYIMDIALFGEELRRQLKVGKLKSDKVIFSIASSKIANREITLPPMREKKIMDVIKTGVSEYFPIDVKDYIISYLLLEKNTSARKVKAQQKKLDKKELLLKKKQQKLEKKARKKKSTTEIIADKMELMESGLTDPINQSAGVNPNSENLNKKHMRVSLFAVPSALVKNYYNFAKAMHFDIVSLDYSGNSSYQVIKRQANRGTNVYVQLNEKDTMISILREDVLILQRTVGYGISMLTDVVMEQDYYQVSTSEEALELLSNHNLLMEGVQKNDSDLYDPSFLEADAAAASEFVRAAETSKKHEEQKMLAARRNITESLHYLSGSVSRMLDYYKANHKNEEINKIYITGSGVRIKGLDKFLYSETGLQYKKMDKLWMVSARKKAALYRKNPGEFISCAGAVLNPIDFVPKELIEKKQKRSAIAATIIFTMTCLAASAGIIYVGYSDYMTAQQELTEVNDRKDALPDISAVYNDNEKAVKELEGLQEFEVSTKSNNEYIIAVLKELEEKLPTGTTINTMQFTESGISMSATADDHNVGANKLQAKILTQLETIEYFASIDITLDSMEEGAEGSLIEFTITCSYKQ